MSYSALDGTEAQLIAQQEAQALHALRVSQVVNDNSTGVCLQCDGDIPEARLAAIPNAMYCVHCQEIVERKGPRFIARNPYVP
jgi:phage/conjugal plasmid C-4 type zinc finger TraR family protein